MKSRITRKKHIYIIAEAGVNHNGSLKLAKKLIDIACDAGADAVKFQTWLPGELTGKFAFKVDYLDTTTSQDESRFELSRRLCLSYDAFRELKLYTDNKKIEFLSTPDGFKSLDFLVDELSIPIIKVGSTELNHLSFLQAVALKNLPVILSTGLGNIDEVSLALETLRHYGGNDLPITLLQCTSEYPAPIEEMNLNVIKTYEKKFKNIKVGLSDHSNGFEASIAAAAMGSQIIEKHFTLDKNMEGPDHSASLDPEELDRFVKSIRTTERMLGNGIKEPTESEKKNLEGIRRSVVASNNLKSGVILRKEDLICKRPGTGISPTKIDSLIGRRINKDLLEDEPIKEEYLSD